MLEDVIYRFQYNSVVILTFFFLCLVILIIDKIFMISSASLYYIDENEATPSLSQAIQMKKLSQAGVLTEERIQAILTEEKPNQKLKIKVPLERIQNYFPPDASAKEIEDTIVEALKDYRQKQKANGIDNRATSSLILHLLDALEVLL